ncbi:hypothetical protein FQR65_LT16504 [Abscondita terminalis]|nr:hypothetical protein FQR65_LT16504 [Abscondita terminalis]
MENFMNTADMNYFASAADFAGSISLLRNYFNSPSRAHKNWPPFLGIFNFIGSKNIKLKDYLKTITIKNFTTQSRKVYDIPLTYEVFGQDLYTAPVVLVNHALTGNSAVTGELGWWKDAIGEGNPIDTNTIPVLD